MKSDSSTSIPWKTASLCRYTQTRSYIREVPLRMLQLQGRT